MFRRVLEKFCEKDDNDWGPGRRMFHVFVLAQTTPTKSEDILCHPRLYSQNFSKTRKNLDKYYDFIQNDRLAASIN